MKSFWSKNKRAGSAWPVLTRLQTFTTPQISLSSFEHCIVPSTFTNFPKRASASSLTSQIFHRPTAVRVNEKFSLFDMSSNPPEFKKAFRILETDSNLLPNSLHLLQISTRGIDCTRVYHLLISFSSHLPAILRSDA